MDGIISWERQRLWFNIYICAAWRVISSAGICSLIGALTYGFFLLVGALGRASKANAAAALAVPMRVLIIRMYLGWLLTTLFSVAIAGPTPPPGLVRGILSAFGLLA